MDDDDTTQATGDRPRHMGSSRSGGGGGLRRAAAPLVLAAVALGAGGGSLVLAGDDPAAALGDRGTATTPVLAARRVPDVLAEPVAERRLTGELQAWLAQSPPDTCLVVEDQGDTVFSHNPTTPLTGASTQKLLTATALLLALGPDAHLQTTVVAAEAPEGGVVAGDLYVVGGGDALLATPAWRDHFTRQPRVITDVDGLADAIVDAGVTRIDGGVVGDDSRYDDVTYHPSWPSRFADQRVVGLIDSLTVNDGFASFPSPGAAATAINPAADPAVDAARVLTDLLRARGVTVAGEPATGAAPTGAAEVATLSSGTVAEVVAEMLTNSDNETAEAAIKEVGVSTGGEGTWAAGTAGVTQLLTEAGVAMEGITVEDGSGLSIGNRLSCETLVDVLTLAETGPVVRSGLSIAGQRGTLGDLWQGTPVEGHLRGKTGTLRNATALAGEVDLTQGGTITFAYVANVPDPNEVTQAGVGIPALPEILMAYPRDVDLAQLQPAPAG